MSRAGFVSEDDMKMTTAEAGESGLRVAGGCVSW